MVEYPSVSVKNLLTSPTLDIFDKATITRIRQKQAQQQQLSFVVNFEEKGWFSGQQYNVVGEMNYKG